MRSSPLPLRSFPPQSRLAADSAAAWEKLVKERARKAGF
jgi:hypothetical protein